MTKTTAIVTLGAEDIKGKIYTIRGMQVMLDRDLANLYQVETKNLNRAVKRNIDRFPSWLMFQLNAKEHEILRCQNGTSSLDQHGGRRYLPYVCTEQGVAMLSVILRSEVAVKVSLQIMNAFVVMRKIIASNVTLLDRMDRIEVKQLESDQKFDRIFKALENHTVKPQQGIFFNGEVFDAYVFVSKLIKQAKKSIVLIDNYVDESVLMLLTKRAKNVFATIYTKDISKKLQLDLKKHNEQYAAVEIKIFKDAHDRFLILDNKEVYHIGASLKDLGKKWFAFSKLDQQAWKVIKKTGEMG
ncbi:MAG: ORF6N domain-containing protein [Gammaproteobacteria bacterium]|nr:ORF6N domain-containing protein [Gammaproteobacteria bacterium]